MKRTIILFGLLVWSVAVFVVGAQLSHRAASPAGRGRILHYADPMHPAYTSDRPGTAPDCGMPLEPVYADDRREGPAVAVPQGIQLDAHSLQLAGVQTTPLEKVPYRSTLRLSGRVAPDETRVYKLNAGIEGYIQDVSPVTTGSDVRKDQVLATFSAPNATMTIQTFIINLGAEERFRQSIAQGTPDGQNGPAVNANVQQRVQQMQNLGVSAAQMDEIRRTRELPSKIRIVAPADGLVLSRNVSLGQKFDRGAEWYRIADLSKVWVIADLFEADARELQSGMRAQLYVRGQSRTLEGVVSQARPEFDIDSRTLKVRVEVANPGYLLRPDMLVEVAIEGRPETVLAAPADAVLDSGLKKTVFVEAMDGSIEAREVQTGRRFADHVEIIAGVETGERIVTGANFLLDSETRLKRVSAQATAAVKDPICGMTLDRAGASFHAEAGGKVYHFCSARCERDFVARRKALSASAGSD